MRWTVPVLGGGVPVLAEGDGGGTVVILAHGAGGHMEQKTVVWLADLASKAFSADTEGAEPGAGRSSPGSAPSVSVVRFNFLYKAQGRGMPDRMPVLMGTYRAVISSVLQTLMPEMLIIGGHSMGGRTASMIESDGQTANGLLLFGYPLHPAGQPEKLRDAHLPNIKTPTLQLNGTEDLLCTREIMDRVVTGLDPEVWHLRWIEAADHSYAVKKVSGRTKPDVEAEICSAITAMRPNWER